MNRCTPRSARSALAWAVVFGLLPGGLGWAQQAATAPVQNLQGLSFEELANITVTTANRKEESIFRVPAAMSVLESGEIARAGATRLVDVLRLFPGVHVTQINPAAWGVAIRGFNSQDSRKLLVLRDGRSVFDRLFSGVWWDVQDPLLDDIAQIEVVRGPGGSLWGSNAVNGVINIISKPAKETVGTRVAAIAEDDGSVVGSWRHGWSAGPQTQVRLSLQGRETADAPDLVGSVGRNGNRLFTGALRLDHDGGAANTFTLFGNLHVGRMRQALSLPVLTAPYQKIFSDDVTTFGASLHGRWDRELDTRGKFSLQAYYDYFERGPISLDQKNHTVDLDFLHSLPEGTTHRLSWGAGGRLIADDLASGSATLRFHPPSARRTYFNAFVQDEIVLVPDRVRLTAGARLEHNHYSGWEFQPSARLLMTPNDRSSFWASIARAVRAPDRASEFSLRLATIPPGVSAGSRLTEVVFQGNPAVESEELLACEAGLRWRASEVWQIEASVFANDYDKLVGFAPGPLLNATDPLRNVSILTATNNSVGKTWGGEVSVSGEPMRGWRLSANVSYLRMNLQGPGIPFLDNAEGQNPRHTASLHSSHDLSPAWRLDLVGRYVDSLPDWNVPAYAVADVQLVWKWSATGQVYISLRNLGREKHFEAPSGRSGTPSAMVLRIVGVGFNQSF